MNHDLNMRVMPRARTDRFVLYESGEQSLVVMGVLQAEDKLIVGIQAFLKDRNLESTALLLKPLQLVSIVATVLSALKVLCRGGVEDFINQIKKEKISWFHRWVTDSKESEHWCNIGE